MLETQSQDDKYAAIAPFYRAMMETRGHFALQADLVTELLAQSAFSRDALILDASCGTADVVGQLFERGFRNVRGIDASTAMLKEARLPAGLGGDTVMQCHWDAADEYLASRGPFDLIFVLGNAFTHAEREEMPQLVHTFATGLSRGGVLALDTRPWEIDRSSGYLTQPGRQVGVWRPLPSVTIDGRVWDLADRCAYDRAHQILDFRFRRVSADGHDRDAELDSSFCLTPFTAADAIAWMRGAGLLKVEQMHYPDYPYVIIHGRRC